MYPVYAVGAFTVDTVVIPETSTKHEEGYGAQRRGVGGGVAHPPSVFRAPTTWPESCGRVPNSLITCDLHLRSMTLRVWDVWYNIYDI